MKKFCCLMVMALLWGFAATAKGWSALPLLIEQGRQQDEKGMMPFSEEGQQEDAGDTRDADQAWGLPPEQTASTRAGSSSPLIGFATYSDSPPQPPLLGYLFPPPRR